MLIVMDRSTHEEHLSQPVQTNKQFEIAVTFLTVYNGIFNVTNPNNKFYFKKSITDEEGFIQITKPPGAYEIETLNKYFKPIFIDEKLFTEANYPFTIKPKISTLGSILEISPQGPVISFMVDDSFSDLLGFDAITLYEEKNLSPNPVDFLSIDKIFI